MFNKLKRNSVAALCCLTLGTIFFPSISGAQQLQLKDFVLFAGGPNCTNCSVQVGSTSTIAAGNIGSNGNVITSGGPTINGRIHSNKTVTLSNGTNVGGLITVGNAGAPVQSIAFTMGTNGILNGNIEVRGSSTVSNATLNGYLRRPPLATYTGPNPALGEIEGTPAIPVLPQLPALTNLNLPENAFGTQPVNSTREISAGKFGKMTLAGGRTVTFKDTGTYIFESIKNTGAVNTFIFNFNGKPGNIRILVHKDVDLGKAVVSVVGGGDASRVYMEVRGDGSTYNGIAFNIASGSTNSNEAEWQGTVFAPNGDISVGSGSNTSKAVGALISGRNVIVRSSLEVQFMPFSGCDPVVDAGPERNTNCDNPVTQLTGSSTTPNAIFSWTGPAGGIVSGANTATPTVNKGGKYYLTVTNPICGFTATDSTVVNFTPCILPYYPPSSQGKVNQPIGSELNSLYYNFGNVQDSARTIFLITGTKVLIDVIAKQNQVATLRSLLLSPAYGMTDTISNGANSLIITGQFPIANLLKLDSLPTLISYVRPSFPPMSNAGIALNSGDTSMRTNLVRNGFGVSGAGIKVGVLSDSYNTLGGAALDVSNGDLPGSNNPAGDTAVVDVLLEYPYGARSDEGRGMLQIVHDIAPGAKLAFRTGFITAGDFAVGIRQLANEGCKVVIDDITFITEPFFRNGAVANAIQAVNAQGVSYVTAAGNFGGKSYEANFNPAPAPAPLTGLAHNFSGGDILQNASVKGTTLKPGVYTIVLQWIDNIYSLGNTTQGTVHDLDIYLTDDNGSQLFGFNRNNLGGDPIEVLPFTVTATTNTNILVVNSNATAGQSLAGLRFKYVVFRGDFVMNEHKTADSSTIVGQGNSPEAITVGAAFYKTSPAFGVTDQNLLKVMSFSSVGGTNFNGSPAQKPDLVGPNGVNTTVALGADIEQDADNFSNFFGTSAAAPHVGAAVALIMQAHKKFYNATLTPQQIKALVKATAVDMHTTGFDYFSGAGLIQVDAAVRTLANPKPFISGIALEDSSIQPGTQPMQIIVTGNYLTDSTIIYLGNIALETIVLNNQQATATLPVFTGSDSVYAYNPSITPSNLDGGFSNGVSITGAAKRNVKITADSKLKKYGEVMPAFTATILVDNVPLADTSLSNNGINLNSLGLQSLTFTTTADNSSNVGSYAINAVRVFDPATADSQLLKLYNYEFVVGTLTIQKMPITIQPVNKTINYGEAVGQIDFTYQYDASKLVSASQFDELVRTSHRTTVPSNALAVVNGFNLPNGNTVLSAADLTNLSMMASFQALNNSRKLLVENNRYVPFITGANELNAHYLIDVSAQSLLNFKNSPATSSFINAREGISSKAILSEAALASGSAQVNLATGLQPIINGSLAPMINRVNTTLAPIINRQLVQLVNARLVDAGTLQPIINAEPVQIVNRQLVQLVNNQIVFLGDGAMAQLYDQSLVQMVNGQLAPLINGVLQPIINAEDVIFQNGVYVNAATLQPIINGSLVQLINRQLVQLVNAATLQPIINAATLQPIINASLVQLVNTQLVQLVNAGLLGQGITNTGVIIDSNDVALQNGWLGAMIGVNMITGLDAGTQRVVPGIFVNPNFEVSYALGQVVINKPTITIKAKDTTKLFGDPLVLNKASFTIVSGTLAPGERIDSVTLTSAGTAGSAPVGFYDINVSEPFVVSGLNTNNYNFNVQKGTLTVLNNPCLITHSTFSVFGSTANPGTPTTMWLNITTKVSGQLTQPGDFLNFRGGSVTFNKVTSSPTVSGLSIPDGRIIAVAGVTAPVTRFDIATNTWITSVPPGFSSTSDIFISGAIINSSNGFKRQNGANSVVRGIFTSNRQFNDQWAYGLAAYQPQFSYADVDGEGDVVAINGSYRAGTPLTMISRLVNGGSGGGGNNYSGSSSSMDNYNACLVTTSTPVNSFVGRGVEPEAVVEKIEFASRLDVFPNPAKGYVMISFVPGGEGSSTVTILSSNGVVVKQLAQVESGKGRIQMQRIDVSGWAPGLYLVQYDNNGERMIRKLIITR